MIDPVSSAMLALTSRSPAAFGLVFLAGLVTSVGPCIAPRYIALAAIANGSRRPLLPTLSFVGGLISALVSLGFAAGLLGTLWSISSAIYLLLAVGLIASGCVALVRAVPAPAGAAGCSHGASRTPEPQSLGAIFVLGAGSAFVISPCCTPIVTTVVATSTAIGQPFTGALLLLSYAAGHTLPLFSCGPLSAAVARLAPRAALGQAPAIVGGVLMLALGVYYGVLA